MENETALKEKLEEEERLLEGELSQLGAKGEGPELTVTKPAGEEFGADRNDNADIMEDLQESTAAASELTMRLSAVKNAIKKINDGTFGSCEVCGNEIEGDRLMANPAAPTCKQHME